MDLDDLRIKANRHGYVYLTTFTRPTDNKEFYYIGQHTALNLDRRYYGSGTLLKRYVAKYGDRGNINVRILCWTYSQPELDFCEDLAISSGRIEFEKLCLNIREGGSYGRHTESTKMKIRMGNLGKVRSEETKAALRRASVGRTQTEATKAKISASKLGVSIWTAADRAAMSLKRLGKKLGPHSKETREKLSKINLGKTLSLETRKKISIANKGRKRTEETKKRMSESWRNRAPMSDATKAKISASLKARARIRD